MTGHGSRPYSQRHGVAYNAMASETDQPSMADAPFHCPPEKEYETEAPFLRDGGAK